MTRLEFHKKAHYFLLIFLAFSLPFPLLFSNVLIFIILANHLAEAKIISHLKDLWKNELNRYFLILYLIITISAFFSENTNENASILERKLAFLAFPILLFKPIDFNVFRRILIAFIIGVFIALSYALIVSTYQYYLSGNLNVFFYHSLAGKIGMNAIYLSAYLVFCLFIFIYFYKNTERKYHILIIVLFLFFLVGLILLSSKMMLFVLCFGLIYFVFANKEFSLNKKIYILVPLILLALSTFLIPQVKSRFLLEISSNLQVVNLQKYSYDTRFTGTTLRLTIWKHCYNILERGNDWFFGVGISDFQNLLNTEYINSGMYVGNPTLKDSGYLGYGPHNQYIETFFSMGLIGFSLFILMLYRQLIFAFRSFNYLFVLFVFLNLFFFLSESSLSTNKGIVFYMFFTMIFSSLSSSYKIENKE